MSPFSLKLHSCTKVIVFHDILIVKLIRSYKDIPLAWDQCDQIIDQLSELPQIDLVHLVVFYYVVILLLQFQLICEVV